MDFWAEDQVAGERRDGGRVQVTGVVADRDVWLVAVPIPGRPRAHGFGPTRLELRGLDVQDDRALVTERPDVTGVAVGVLAGRGCRLYRRQGHGRARIHDGGVHLFGRRQVGEALLQGPCGKGGGGVGRQVAAYIEAAFTRRLHLPVRRVQAELLRAGHDAALGFRPLLVAEALGPVDLRPGHPDVALIDHGQRPLGRDREVTIGQRPALSAGERHSLSPSGLKRGLEAFGDQLAHAVDAIFEVVEFALEVGDELGDPEFHGVQGGRSRGGA